MADYLPGILSFPPDKKLSPTDYDKQINNYIKELGKVPIKVWTSSFEKQSLLDLLNPAENSIPYLIALFEHTATIGKDRKRFDDVLNRTIIYYASFDPVQVRYVGEFWRKHFEWATEAVQYAGLQDLSPLSTALLRLDPTAGTFTTNHVYFLRACLNNGVPRQALPIIDNPIYAFPHANPKGVPEDLPSEDYELSNAYITAKSGFSGKLHPEYILEYYLLAAHISIGIRSWSRARLFLEYVILTPSSQHTVSALQVEAYKKWILVGLLAEGKLFPYPRTAEQSIMKAIKSASKPYEILGEDFEKRDVRKFQAEMDVGTQIWYEDGNLTLVKEASEALLRFRVRDLQKTYAALPVSRVATHLSFSADATLQMVSQMIRAGHLNASVTPGATAGEAVLRFHVNDAPASSAAAQKDDLSAQTARIERLVSYVQDADRRSQLTKEYVDVQKRNKRTGPESDMADQMDLTWDQPGGAGGVIQGLDEEGDEDIMGS